MVPIVMKNSAGEELAAPAEVWLGFLLASLPVGHLDQLWDETQAFMARNPPKPARPAIQIARG